MLIKLKFLGDKILNGEKFEFSNRHREESITVDKKKEGATNQEIAQKTNYQ